MDPVHRVAKMKDTQRYTVGKTVGHVIERINENNRLSPGISRALCAKSYVAELIKELLRQ